MFIIHTLILGPLENNTYLIADEETGQAAIIDPSFEREPIIDIINQYKYLPKYILITHAHFDHTVNAIALSDQFSPPVPIALHPSDLQLWENGSGAEYFGIQFKPDRRPDLNLYHRQKILLGDKEIEVRHVPGHSPGSLVFVLHPNQLVLTGDLIFYRGVGRTDLPGGNATHLTKSITSQIFTLPGNYQLLPGHGPSTTVAEEIRFNPYI